MPTRSAQNRVPAAVTRLASLSALDTDAQAALRAALDRSRRHNPRRELLTEGKEITETLLILSGWGARVRNLVDGRRQIMNFLLPGDLIGLHDHDRPISSSTVIALTEVDACVAPDPAASSALRRAYALSRAIEDAYFQAQIVRLGRLNAQERIADLLLELLERLERAGLAEEGRFLMPITQEVLADALGLTSVHVNRTLQGLRRTGAVDWRGREISLPTPDVLRRQIGREVTRVTAS